MAIFCSFHTISNLTLMQFNDDHVCVLARGVQEQDHDGLGRGNHLRRGARVLIRDVRGFLKAQYLKFSMSTA